MHVSPKNDIDANLNMLGINLKFRKESTINM